MTGDRRLVWNPMAGEVAAAPAPAGTVLAFHRSLPGYARTPLIDAPSLADALGVRQVWVKDESSRLELPSFKILGASWATYRALCERLDADPADVAGLGGLRERLVGTTPLELVAATDGNHGRAVARMARLLGLTCHIFVPGDMAIPRISAIESEGARVSVVDGGYDEAVALSAEAAAADRVVISDTSWPGYERVPNWVVEGYATIGAEIDDSLRRNGAPPPDVVAVQIGVGAFAAAMVRHFRPQGATLVGVEPTRADCVIASIEAGAITTIPGPQDSIMAGLNCGRPSLVAWPVVAGGLDVCVTIEDDVAKAAMRLLAAAGIVSGESGVGGFAGLLDHRHELNLDREASVLVISTEGATDPDHFERVVGRPHEAVGSAGG